LLSGRPTVRSVTDVLEGTIARIAEDVDMVGRAEERACRQTADLAELCERARRPKQRSDDCLKAASGREDPDLARNHARAAVHECIQSLGDHRR
jgi:hypothetical protein